MLIETNRLIIKEFTLEMARDVHLNSLDDDVRKFVPDEVFETIEESKETIEFLISQYASIEGPLVYPIFTKELSENIGYVQLAPLEDGEWEIGYHIAKRFTGKGYCTEAVDAFLPFMAEKLGISRVYGVCVKENLASIGVLNKCGFREAFSGIGEYQGNRREIYKSVWEK